MNTEKSNNAWRWLSVLLLSVLAGGIFWQLRPRREAADPASESTPTETAPAADANSAATAPAAPTSVTNELAEKLGIEISALQVAVGGTRISFRYRVLDSARATALTNEVYKAFLLDSPGRLLTRPHTPVGAGLRQDSGQPLRSGRTYSYFFPNPGQAVKPGDQVTLVIGNLQAPNLVVR
jgi:hypothetical protein